MSVDFDEIHLFQLDESSARSNPKPSTSKSHSEFVKRPKYDPKKGLRTTMKPAKPQKSYHTDMEKFAEMMKHSIAEGLLASFVQWIPFN